MNPYVGPRRFEEQDAPFFYGREKESRDLLAFVVSEPPVLFYAQSGAGKSSLINTSLVPGLRDDNFEVLPVGRVGGNLPEGISEVRNIYTFNLLSNLEPEADPNRFTKTMLTDYLSKRTGSNGQRSYRVLIIDQFEEVVTHHPGRWRDREDFFWQLQAAIHNDPNLWVVLSMREDHFAAVESYAEILPGGLRARFRMERLRLAAAEMAIEKPAATAGKPFEEGVAKELVKNLSLIRDTENVEGGQRYGEYVEPVQLQVVCYQLWENLKDRPMSRITQVHVQQLGNVDRALGAFYDTAVQEVVAQSSISEIMLRNWFEKKLITEAHTRGTVYQGTEETEGLANEAVNQLADKYLLRSERRAGAVWYELVHDRFVDPILQTNASWFDKKGLLFQAANAWEQSGRSAAKLYLGEQLKDTLANVDWRNAEPLVIDFLRECGRGNQDILQREKIQQQELERAKQLAEVQTKSAQALRIYLAIAGLFLLVAIGSSIIAINRSNDNREQAKILAEQAMSLEISVAESSLLTNSLQIEKATSQALAATSQALAATSQTLAKINQAQAGTSEALAANAANALATSRSLSAEVSELNSQNIQNAAIVATISANSTKNAHAAEAQEALNASTAERITFVPGTFYGEASDSLGSNSQKRYVLRALAGQTMTVNFPSKTGSYSVSIQGENGSIIARCEDVQDNCSGSLPANQDYIVTVTSINGGNYTIRITIV